jgi:hypothetical protein
MRMNRKSLFFCTCLISACTDYGVLNSETPAEPPISQFDPSKNILSGGIAGRICTPSGDSFVSDARIWISLSDDTEVAATSDQQGYFTLRNVPPGLHTVHVQKGTHFSTQFQAEVIKSYTTTLGEYKCLDSTLEIAVVTGSFDSVQTSLNSLGFTPELYDGMERSDTDYLSLIGNPAELAKYDILFFNCGMSEEWFYNDPEYTSLSANEIQENLYDFVANGGSIYTSDWAYYILEATFPQSIDFAGDDDSPGAAAVGLDGTYEVQVMDNGFQKALGGATQASIRFEFPSWVVPLSSSNAHVLIEGEISYYENWANVKTAQVPLVLSYSPTNNEGRALYTSFHNESQLTTDMETILEEILFSL